MYLTAGLPGSKAKDFRRDGVNQRATAIWLDGEAVNAMGLCGTNFTETESGM